MIRSAEEVGQERKVQAWLGEVRESLNRRNSKLYIEIIQIKTPDPGIQMKGTSIQFRAMLGWGGRACISIFSSCLVRGR